MRVRVAEGRGQETSQEQGAGDSEEGGVRTPRWDGSRCRHGRAADHHTGYSIKDFV